MKILSKRHPNKPVPAIQHITMQVTTIPMRKLFYVDVGTMPPERMEKYIGSIKAAYDPKSIVEDLIFPAFKEGRGSKVEYLPSPPEEIKLTVNYDEDMQKAYASGFISRKSMLEFANIYPME